MFEFLDLRKNHGKEEVRARDLFFALWIPDLFMERVQQAGEWPLFCPAEAPGLNEVYGDEFKVLFEKYEKEGRARKVIPAQKLWTAILEAQVGEFSPSYLGSGTLLRLHLRFQRLETPSCSTRTPRTVRSFCVPPLRSLAHLTLLANTGKSNQKNLGTIKSSNLCTEIIEYSAPDEVLVPSPLGPLSCGR